MLAALGASPALAATVLGNPGVQPQLDQNSAGRAEAFKTTASAAGTVTTLQVYVDAMSASTKLTAGLYRDSAGRPGALIAQGSTTAPAAGTWNAVDLGAGGAVTAGTAYWIAILSPTGSGTLRFRDASLTTVGAESSSSGALTTLPASWTRAATYKDGNLSAYGTTSDAPAVPVLSVTPANLSFAATTGGAAPAARTLSVTNTGTGALSFTAADDAPWLSVTPASGSAPQTLQVSAATGSLTAGTYNASVTVTSAGTQGSPAAIPVTFTVTDPPPPAPAVLATSPASLSFSATAGGSPPAAKTISVTNTGGGSLSFTVADDAPWLSVTPASGSAPQTLQATAATGSLAAGTYTATVTVTSTGTQGSPAAIPVTFTVTDPPTTGGVPGDWLQVDHDAMRSGTATDETTITTANASTLSQLFKADLDGKMTAQPLFAGGVTVGGQTRDVLIAFTNANSVYALDGTTGSVLWKRTFPGNSPDNCAVPGGYGITASGAIDRARGRVYAVSTDGSLRTIALSDGTEAVPAVPVIPNPATNKLWGGVTLLGSTMYVASASDGCDTPPFRGAIHRIDLGGTNPVKTATWDIVPGIPAPGGGGGVWGYGGVSANPANGHVYAATGADDAEQYTAYADRLVALDASLNLLGSWKPDFPATFPCGGTPCDLDFGSTPAVFQPSGCPTMIAAGNKDGNLYVTSTARLEANLPPEQTLKLNITHDWLGSGGIGGVPAYWEAGRKLFVSTAGPGFGGVAGGMIALNIGADCTLTPAWSRQVGQAPTGGGVGYPPSTPTVANGVVFVGEGLSAKVRSFNATTGTPLWDSAGLGAGVFAAPIVAKGTLYAATWNGFFDSGLGSVYAFRPGATPPSPVLSVAPSSLAFAATTGGASPAAKTLSVTNTGGGSLGFTVADDAPWLSVTPASGSAPQTLQVTAAPGSLAAGTYTATVTVTSAGTQGSPASIPVTFTVTDTPPPPPPPNGTFLLGNQALETQNDSNSAGSAEAFETTATAAGTLAKLSIYVGSTSTATKLVAGVYTDAGGHPGALLGQGSITTITKSAFNDILVSGPAVTAGTKYWIAILAPTGIIAFRDRAGGCKSESSSQNTLTALPATWTTGRLFTDCPLSGYGTN